MRALRLRRLRRLRRLPTALALGALLGCTPERAPLDLRSGTGSVRALCEARCARSARCDDGGATRDCACGDVREEPLLRADWTGAAIACLARDPCAGDPCEAEAYRASGIGPLAWPRVVVRCLQRGDECGGTADACRHLAAMTEAAQAAVDPCFDAPCDAYARCFQAFVAARVAPAVPAWR